jgi:hypothetical protein
MRSAVFAIALIAPAAWAMAGPLIACPALLQVGHKAADFESADVFVGPPEKQVSLVPDLDTSEWRWAARRDEKRYLVCRYRHSKSTITFPIPPSANYCRLGGGPHKNVAECGIR